LLISVIMSSGKVIIVAIADITRSSQHLRLTFPNRISLGELSLPVPIIGWQVLFTLLLTVPILIIALERVTIPNSIEITSYFLPIFTLSLPTIDHTYSIVLLTNGVKIMLDHVYVGCLTQGV
jgi:hypothetical protein